MEEFIIKYFTDDLNYYTKEKIEMIINSEGKILKNDNRSFVKVVEIEGRKVIVKRPKEKNRRKWIRFISLFRKSETISVLETMEILNKNNIKTNEAIASLEKRKFGMVVDSYILYTYLEGEKLRAEDVFDLIGMLKKIHLLGYLHGDAQFTNFLKENGIFFTIDSNLKNKKLGKISENIEYLRVADDFEEIEKKMDKNNIYYKLAKALLNIEKSIRRLKKKIRIKFKIKRY